MLPSPQKSQRYILIISELLRATGSGATAIHSVHTYSLFRNEKRKIDTALSTFFWRLLKKSTKETPKYAWSILKVVPRYSNNSKWCILCLNEKLLIATYPVIK